MLYIIGGTSRSGKTTITRQIAESENIPYLSLDYLVMGFTNGIPEYGIHDKLFPDEIAKKMWGFLKAMCENIIWVGKDYILEGEAILPEQVNELLQKYPDKVKACFVGFCEVAIDKKVNDVKIHSAGPNDWLSTEPDEYIINHISNMIGYSLQLKEECKKANVKYFDTSNKFTETIDEVVKYLVKERPKGTLL